MPGAPPIPAEQARQEVRKARASVACRLARRAAKPTPQTRSFGRVSPRAGASSRGEESASRCCGAVGAYIRAGALRLICRSTTLRCWWAIRRRRRSGPSSLGATIHACKSAKASMAAAEMRPGAAAGSAAERRCARGCLRVMRFAASAARCTPRDSTPSPARVRVSRSSALAQRDRPHVGAGHEALRPAPGRVPPRWGFVGSTIALHGIHEVDSGECFASPRTASKVSERLNPPCSSAQEKDGAWRVPHPISTGAARTRRAVFGRQVHVTVVDVAGDCRCSWSCSLVGLWVRHWRRDRRR